MVVGVLRLELFLPMAQSLKDKRAVVRSLKDQLRGRFPIAVAEVEPSDRWQRVSVGVAAVGTDRALVESILRQVTAWVRHSRLAELVQVEQELW